MKDYVGIKIKGFKFENGTTGIYYHKSMDKNLDKIGEVIDQDSISVKIRFDDNICFYPISLAPKYVTDKKQEQKQRLVEIMRGDEEIGLYNNNIKNDKIFKEGDKVFDYLFGWGKVASVYSGYSEYPINVTFNKCNRFYKADGSYMDKTNQTLSFTEYTLEGFSQERP